jgi:uncharacterized protein YxjI
MPKRQQNILADFTQDTYLVRRKIFKFLGAAFHIYDSSGNVAFYSEAKAFKLKEDIRLYSDESMQVEVLKIKARQIVDFSAAYDVIDTVSNTKVGALKRKGWKSIIRDKWIILDASESEIGYIQEDSLLFAYIRRHVTNLFPQTFYGFVREEKVCMLKQNFNPGVMKIKLDFSMDNIGLLDKRLGIAAAVILCAIERRQE